ncbi:MULTISPECIES: FAD-dependent monooxygenase [unclassified Beijerinckia]|uniref:FAD-dependent monooxygenase n=1 Tax=unclassified Beijerinckia TaxID=2638183 RepID=UPI00089B8B61|nr:MULTISPECIES: FAD-dependent monooxygenase [unclassified Beijerinckia]MDH7794861.1 2-polyprenyl-6-methoxyphenol hydroxylase-like FAD-dependent oxidoreductase [Beijerinckia sp. GAS462]SEB78193.1 2-polyprenyl-6-methoxyphenol hydroxylase [Beijerinckia sp. 28-YEA-48]
MKSHYQIIIVGGGPVGVGLATEFGQRGVSCLLVEPRTTLSKVPKGQNLTQRTLEHFATWGLEKELRAARLMPKGYPIGELTAYGNLTSDYWHAPAGRELVRAFYAQDNERLPQYQMEAVLRKNVVTLASVDTLFGWEAGPVVQDANGVRVEIRSIDTNERVLVSGDYLVGCDGAHSTVRTQLGIERNKQDYEQNMLLAVFRSPELSKYLERFPQRSTYRVLRPELKGYWQFFGRISEPDEWFFHAPVPMDADIKTFDSVGLIREAAGFDCNCDFEHVSFWKMRVAVAEQYQLGRIFIAGDAAHSHPPYGGFGLNNGLEDIRNLGWKIAARVQGWGSDRLLESYSIERRPVFWETADDFITSRIKRDAAFLDRYNPQVDKTEFETAWQGYATDIGSRFQQYEPNYEGSPVVCGPVGGVNTAHGTHAVRARAGHHLAPVPMSSGRNSFEELGFDFTLLAFGAPDDDVASFTSAAADLGIPLKVVRDSLDGGRESYEANLILVRPDQYVVWRSDLNHVDAASILARATGRS